MVEGVLESVGSFFYCINAMSYIFHQRLFLARSNNSVLAILILFHFLKVFWLRF